jgi:transcription-repair coupling factor (superfamily II helicase)
VALFPAWESLPYEGISPAPEIAARRAAAARAMRGVVSGAFVVVAPALAAIQGIPPDLGAHEPLVVSKGATVAPDALAERLVALGYTRADVVEHRGEFAVRGGTLDVFPGVARRPVRAEFWGDDVDSLREFSAATQLSTSSVDRALIDPVRVLLPTAEVRERAERAAPRHLGRFRDGLARLGEGLEFEGMETLAGLVYEHLEPPVSLLPRGAWVVLSPGRRVADRAGRVAEEAAALAAATQWPAAPFVTALDEAVGGRQPGRDGGPPGRPGRDRPPRGGRGRGARIARPGARAGRRAGGRGRCGGGAGRRRVRVPAGQARGGGGGGLLRGPAAHAPAAQGGAPAGGRDRPRARTR